LEHFRGRDSGADRRILFNGSWGKWVRRSMLDSSGSGFGVTAFLEWGSRVLFQYYLGIRQERMRKKTENICPNNLTLLRLEPGHNARPVISLTAEYSKDPALCPNRPRYSQNKHIYS
jgi:hypothetical protein